MPTAETRAGSTRRARVRRGAAAAVVLPLALGLAACGGHPPAPVLPSAGPPRWNPCDALDAALILRKFGTHSVEKDGTPTEPDCRFVPVDPKAGDPVISANYQLTPGNLDQIWKHMGLTKADVLKPSIARADGARVVVDSSKGQLILTGFVQNGDLYQVVNLVDPAPFDQQRDISGVKAMLTAMSKHADETGAGISPSVTATAK